METELADPDGHGVGGFKDSILVTEWNEKSGVRQKIGSGAQNPSELTLL